MDSAFETIKYEAYNLYQATKPLLTNKYCEMKMENCTLVHGPNVFTIIPVCTSSDEDESVMAFSKNHPTNFVYAPVEDTLQKYQIPDVYVREEGNKQTCFNFSYKLAALVCKEAQAKTFLSVCPEPGSYIWVIVTGGKNKSAKKFIKEVESKAKQNKKAEADVWYGGIW
ncbi:Hypothetical protein ZAZAV_454 [Cedratvirus Zaza IHUMI]|uniref:Uncharacterized protein n=1 Tax=Cedratvirus Zaza IHUMI TaxID=2126979 RepID=A0A2R8FFJ1_9VIRU|nr:Hypothetical protein ZAZAV_454 [Cedratvirus Zaza IHUMI]